MTQAVDPGWGDAVKKLPLAFVPTRGMRMAAGSSNGLTTVRVLWLTFTMAMVLIGIVVVLIDQTAPGGGADGRGVAAVVAALGVFLQVISTKFVPPVAGSTMREVRETAHRAFFLRVLFAEPAALFGFMGFVLSGNVAVYAIGAVIGVAGMFDAIPNSRWIDESQQALRESGSDVEFLAAIVGGGINR